MMMPPNHDRCLSGDITVLPTHEGYVIQRVTDDVDSRNWPTLRLLRPWFVARDFALVTSNAAGTRAWFWDGRPSSIVPLDRTQSRRWPSPSGACCEEPGKEFPETSTG